MASDTKTQRFLRLILFLSNSYPKTKDECTAFLAIKDSTFYSYRNSLQTVGFDIRQKDGRYWIEYSEDEHHILKTVFHFSEEEAYILTRSIDMLDESSAGSARLKQKLALFVNQDKAIEAYIQKEKSVLVQSLRKAQREKKQILPACWIILTKQVLWLQTPHCH